MGAKGKTGARGEEEEEEREPTQTRPRKKRSMKNGRRQTKTKLLFSLSFGYRFLVKKTHLAIHVGTPKTHQSTPSPIPPESLYSFYGSNFAVTRKRRFGGGTSSSYADCCCSGCWGVRICKPTLVSPARLCAWKRARMGIVDGMDGDDVAALVKRGSEALNSSVVPGLSSSGRAHCRSGGV